MLLMVGVYTRNMLSYKYINKITLLHQVGISNYFTRMMYGQTTLKLSVLTFSRSHYFLFRIYQGFRI